MLFIEECCLRLTQKPYADIRASIAREFAPCIAKIPAILSGAGASLPGWDVGRGDEVKKVCLIEKDTLSPAAAVFT